MYKKLNKTKILIIVFLILVIAFCVIYASNTSFRFFCDKYIFRKNVAENTLPHIANESGYIFSYNDNIVYLENNVLKFFNKSSNEIAKLELDISNPIFETNGKYLCVAEKNGNKIYLIANKNIVWQKDIEGNIANLSLNKNGYVAISILDTTYETLCKVYDKNRI